MKKMRRPSTPSAPPGTGKTPNQSADVCVWWLKRGCGRMSSEIDSHTRRLMDAQWALISPSRSSNTGRRGHPFRDDRRVVDAIIHPFHAGVAGSAARRVRAVADRVEAAPPLRPHHSRLFPKLRDTILWPQSSIFAEWASRLGREKSANAPDLGP